MGIQPIRSVEGLPTLFRNAVGLALRTFRLMLTHYREGELDTLAKVYKERRRVAFTKVPNVRIETLFA